MDERHLTYAQNTILSKIKDKENIQDNFQDHQEHSDYDAYSDYNDCHGDYYDNE